MAGGNNPKNWSTVSDPTNTSVTTTKNEQNVNPKDWPTLSDSTNTSSVSTKKEQTKLRSDAPDNATGMENIDASTNGTTYGARKKKQLGKTKWSRVQIETLPYRDNKNERPHNMYEFNKYASYQRSNGYESTNGFTNGQENFKGRPFRGSRHGRGNAHRFRRDNAVSTEPRRYQKLPPETEPTTYVEESSGFEDSIQLLIMRQIEFYFSEKNLLKDLYLRHHMDDQGFVPLSTIAEFPRIKRLTNDEQLVLASVKKSCYLEVSNDVKIRPVVEPLRWPIKKDVVLPSLRQNSIVVNTADTYVDLMTTQIYNMCLDTSVYPHMAVPTAHELPWQYIPNGLDKSCVYCPMNVVYSHADANGLTVVGTSDITNGHMCIPGHYEGADPNMFNEEASQYETCDNSDSNGGMFDPVEEVPLQLESESDNLDKNDRMIDPAEEVPSQSEANGDNLGDNEKMLDPCEKVPLHFETNDVTDSTDSSNTSNGDDSTSELVLSCDSDSNDISTQKSEPQDVSPQNSTVVTANGCHDNDTDITDISNELQACSSSLKHSDDTTNVNGFGQLPNDVIIYNKGGKYYVPPSEEILSDSSDVPCENDSSILNKSPEPSR